MMMKFILSCLLTLCICGGAKLQSSFEEIDRSSFCKSKGALEDYYDQDDEDDEFVKPRPWWEEDYDDDDD